MKLDKERQRKREFKSEWVFNLWPNDYSQPPDIYLIHSYNRALPIVQWINKRKGFGQDAIFGWI